MMLKTVYGPPPSDMERIEAAESEEENCVRENEPTPTGLAACKKVDNGRSFS